jgi:hypothetical protein
MFLCHIYHHFLRFTQASAPFPRIVFALVILLGIWDSVTGNYELSSIDLQASVLFLLIIHNSTG